MNRLNCKIIMVSLKLNIMFLLLLYSYLPAQDAQRRGWTKIAEKEGLDIEFIFYSEADNYNNGVVIKLINNNNYKINYKFDLIFRSPQEDKVEIVYGDINPLQIKTGSSDSLFWIPFEDGKFIGEVGITNIEVKKREDKSSL